MNVVLHAADHYGLHGVLTCDTAEIRPDALFNLGSQPRFAVFRAEDDVAMERGISVGHAGEHRRNWELQQQEFSSVAPRRNSIWTLTRGLKSTATFGCPSAT